jgi:hypothetical protein
VSQLVCWGVVPGGMLRHTPFLNWSGGRSRRLRSLFHNHPAEPPKKGVDVRGPAFPYSAIKVNRDSLPTSFAASSVKDDFNSSVTGKTLSHRLERPRLITRNDKKVFL